MTTNTYAAELLFVLDIMSLDTLKTSTFVNQQYIQETIVQYYN
ncbi:hypothetical protein pb186bvf_009765 [Paramecium bursaria]